MSIIGAIAGVAGWLIRIAVVALVAYYVVKKAVKDALCEERNGRKIKK